MTSLILGINGQDGILLSRLLHSKNEILIGVGTQKVRSGDIPPSIPYYSLDIRDTHEIMELINFHKVAAIYNLSGLSSVAQSFQDPQTTFEVNFEAVKSILIAMYGEAKNASVKFFQCSSSEMFGAAVNGHQNENTAFNPQSPYAESKVNAHLVCQEFRDEDFFVSCGILFNHESIFRPKTFVTRKITSSVARIKLGLQQKLTVGNLDAARDWGAASDYVDAINRIMEHNVADDFVIATGKSHTVRDLVTFALRTVDLEDSFDSIVEVDRNLLRKVDLKATVGDAEKIRREIGWKARRTFEELISEMVEFDLKLNSSEH